MILSCCFLGGVLDRFALAGAAIALAGVALTLVLEAGGRLPDFGNGEIYAALAAVAFALSTVISRDRLQRVPLGIFMVFRLGLGALLSVGAVWWRDGATGFGHMLSPLLWQWMAVYGSVFVAGAQICWFSGLKCARPGDVSLAGVFSPVAAILFALVLQGEVPSPALGAGGAVIVLGIVCGQFGARIVRRLQPRLRTAAARTARLDHRAWFSCLS
ncbi:MAG TPA: DMT family transporter [Geminicoccaceae bacterium]|nr:DMT family transporter [Geminicoccaceae bacterium]